MNIQNSAWWLNVNHKFIIGGLDVRTKSFARYVNSFERFILLASKEVNQDSQLISIETSYYTAETVNIIVT